MTIGVGKSVVSHTCSNLVVLIFYGCYFLCSRGQQTYFFQYMRRTKMRIDFCCCFANLNYLGKKKGWKMTLKSERIMLQFASKEKLRERFARQSI